MFDEVKFMLTQTQNALPDAPFSDVVNIVANEQARNDWQGVYRMRDNDDG